MQELSFLSENDKDWAMRSRDRPAPEVDVFCTLDRRLGPRATAHLTEFWQ
jgi:hypothetical protein